MVEFVCEGEERKRERGRGRWREARERGNFAPVLWHARSKRHCRERRKRTCCGRRRPARLSSPVLRVGDRQSDSKRQRKGGRGRGREGERERHRVRQTDRQGGGLDQYDRVALVARRIHVGGFCVFHRLHTVGLKGFHSTRWTTRSGCSLSESELDFS